MVRKLMLACFVEAQRKESGKLCSYILYQYLFWSILPVGHLVIVLVNGAKPAGIQDTLIIWLLTSGKLAATVSRFTG